MSLHRRRVVASCQYQCHGNNDYACRLCSWNELADSQYDDVVDNGGGAGGEGPAHVLAGGGAHGAPTPCHTAARPRRSPSAPASRGLK
jgi:hypothetical protein